MSSVLPQRLKEARIAADLKQKEAAEKIEISNGSLSLYEKGKRDPDPETLLRLADLYNVSIDWLMGRFSSSRKGFGRDHKKATKAFLDLKTYTSFADLPVNIRKELQLPVLYYRVLQKIEDEPVTISESYLPNSLPLKELETILEGVKENPTLSLYKTLESFGRKPIAGKEVVIVDSNPTEEEIDLLEMKEVVPVVRFTRTMFDRSNGLVEYCQLTSRSDRYLLEYEFML